MAPGDSSIELSIVIPTFNYAQFIERAIHSVLSQMSEKSELIVVDDGSSDNTPDVLAALMAMGCPRFRCVRQENAGPAAARNHGFSRAVGRFILFLDADDELLPGAIDKIVQTIEAHRGADLILGAYLARSPSGSESLVSPTPIQGSVRDRVADYLIHKRISVSHGSSVVSRMLLERRPYPVCLRQTEDMPVFAFLVAHAHPALIEEPLVRVHKHNRSLRHDADLAKQSHLHLAAEIFTSLPSECQNLRKDFETKRLFSLFRICCRSADWGTAKCFYRLAFAANWRRALRPKYLGRYLQALLLNLCQT